ncbi:hypothetical protein B0T10DRAFT_479404 [Thelonectria olida]|uniref:Phosphoribosylaminoimidazole-succinocarboxamide synthase n=1 Tax=Thelonectria olida TaxID=1576542 RepID=A0A9P8WC52_9HYPO|nr:hypothetical protein B0T10DRAFT_479404 [Thelonectria olida]
MNFQNMNFDSVEPRRQGPPTFSPDPSRRDDDDDEDDYSLPTLRPYYDLSQRRVSHSHNNSLSTQAAILHAPSPPSLSGSPTEIYGPDRLFPGGPPVPPGFNRPPPAPSVPRTSGDHTVHFDEAQLAMFAAENSARMAGLKDELAIAAGKVTPGVDDTPYIQYALDALTRPRNGGPAPVHFPSSSSDEYSDDGYTAHPRGIAEDLPVLTPPEPAYVEDRLPMEESPLPERYEEPERFEPPRTPVAVRAEPLLREMDSSDPDSSHETVVHHDVDGHPPRSDSPTPSFQSTPSRHIPVITNVRKANRRSRSIPVERAYPPLDYKPPILRPFSMLLLMLFCTLMAAGLIFSAIYSDSGDGLTPYPGSIYSGQFFLFRLLPQILAAIVLIYAQAVDATSQRVLPFALMANEEPSVRYLALFRNIYPNTFLLPSFNGPWQCQLFNVATWLANFTIPLMSTAFTCIFHNHKWVWAAVQGVVWTLAAIYITLLIATTILMIFWFRRWTGLRWDVRSVAHLLPLLAQSSTTKSYEHVDVVQRGTLFKAQLRDRHLDRLGYWQMDGQRMGGMWYGIGSVADDDDLGGRQASYSVVAKKTSYNISPASSRDDLEAEAQYMRHRYQPFSLKDMTIVTGILIMVFIIVAILVASFLPHTRIDRGFLPLLSAKPGKGAFSAANFLYGFVPSLLGMVMFLLFQTVDLSFRMLQPWAELSKPSGSIAQKSVLADYAACLPFQVTFKAAKNGHWRLAVVSLMSTLFVFIPILAGGLFMALTTGRGTVKMFPNMPVFGVLLALLFLFLGCLTLMLPGRRTLRLPHPANCIAELIALCAADESVRDPIFQGVRSADDLESRLGMDRADSREQTMWYFGVAAGRDERRLSVRPIKRFTEKPLRSQRSMRLNVI